MKKKKINIDAIISVICIVLSIYLIFSILKFHEIETLIRYIIIVIILLFDIFIIKRMLTKTKQKGKRKKEKKKNYRVILIIVSAIYIMLSIVLNTLYSYVGKLNKNVIYSSSLVSLNETEEVDLITVKNKKIGIISDNGSDKGYDLAKEIIKEEGLNKNNELVSYDSYAGIISALLEKEITYGFLPSNFADVYSTFEGFENIGQKLKIIVSTEMEESKKDSALLGSSKDISEPFTILLIGIDSTTSNLKQADSFNGDSLILVTFNPKTLTATMLSIPRDSYVPIACFNGQYENKITHSASRGTSCVINTIQNFLDVKIDYYMKINFTGVVDLVNALGGVEIDVPYSFCEQNSKREFGDKMIYVRAGRQILDGEQALAFSRNRKKNSEFCSSEWTQGYRDDFVRANNQQTVIRAILDKMKSFSTVTKIKDILDVLSDNLDTNMDEDTIFSFYNIAKDVMISSSSTNVLTIQKLFIDGVGQTIYDESTRLHLWNYIPNTYSVNEVKDAMKENLGQKEHQLIKSFTYSIKEGYTEKVIGEGPYSFYPTYDLLPDLTEKSLAEAQAWAKNFNLKINVEYKINNNVTEGLVLDQNYPVGKRIDKIDDGTITLTVAKHEEKNEEPKEELTDCLNEQDNKVCILPNFISQKKEDVVSWVNKFSNTIAIYFEYEESDKKAGTIIEQSIKEGTKVKDILEKNTTLIIKIAKENNS